MTRPTRQRLGFGLALLLGLGLLVYFQATAGATTPFSRGLVLATEMGCLTCHGGPLGEALPNPSQNIQVSDGVVPPLVGCEHGAAEFAEWVLLGAPAALRGSQRWQRTQTARAIEMPAFSGRLNEEQVADIRAWALIAARPEARPTGNSSTPWRRAEALAAEHGCFGCHGELGQGGEPNPGSLTGEIPALVGDDFAHLTDGADPIAIAEWIAEGSSERFLSGSPLAPVGRYYMRKQRIQMPAFGGILTAEELQLLIDYCLQLHDLGPLDADSYQAYSARLAAAKTPVTTPATSPLPPDVPPDEALPGPVAALLSEACIRCHGPEKQESEYRMDTRDAAFNGGEIASYLGVKNIVPGEPSASLLFTFITATEEDPENELFPMPPDEEERLSAEQIQLLREWITAGAPWHNSQLLTSTHTD